MYNKQDWIRVILPPNEKKTCFHPSNLLETLSNTGSQKEIDFGFPPKGRPKYIKGHSKTAQSSKKTKLVVWSWLMLIPECFYLDRSLAMTNAQTPTKFAYEIVTL